MKSRTITLELEDEAATTQLGQDIAGAVKSGDLITLEGDLGAGKTTLARAFIRAVAADLDLEVPSPTYTLVQSYRGLFEIAHFDLYRVSDSTEIDDLGLEDALNSGLAIVEWPQNAAGALPPPAIAVNLSENAEGTKTAIIHANAEAENRLRRSFELREFLKNAGWGDASRSLYVGDASTRRYETVELPDQSNRIVMDAPEQPDGPPIKEGKQYSKIAQLSESVAPFVAIDHVLRENGFCAPEIYAADLESGFLMMENLGDEGVIDENRDPIPDRYYVAIELLANAHQFTWPADISAPFGAKHKIPDYDLGAMLIEVELLLNWYMPAITGREPDEADREAFTAAWKSVIGDLERVERGLVMRDFHSPNLIWREELAGSDRLGLIDFQDALIGPSAYDVASLTQDARVTVSEALENSLVSEYCQLRQASGTFDETMFRKSYAIMSVQRCSKILGIFVRLDRRDGKPAYLKHLPRMRDYLRRSIDHEALAPVRQLYQNWDLLREDQG